MHINIWRKSRFFKVAGPNSCGFTLVEVLIVVVILGILAALVIPRIVSQPQTARTAEAMQMLGVLRKAQLDRLDLVGTPGGAYLDIFENENPVPWNQLSLSPPGVGLAMWDIASGVYGDPDGPVFFDYSCGGTSCTATLAGNPSGGAEDAITLDANGTFACSGGFEQPENNGVALNSCVYTGNPR